MNKITTYKGNKCVTPQNFYMNCKSNVNAIAETFCRKLVKDCTSEELGHWDGYLIEFIDFCNENNISLATNNNNRYIVVWKPFEARNIPFHGTFTVQMIDRKQKGKILFERHWG